MRLFRCRGQYDLVLVALGYVHKVDHFLYRYGTVGVDREGGIVGVPEQELQGRLHVGEGYGLGVSVDMVGECPKLRVVLDGYAYGGTRKNISSRNTMSVMEDIENAGSTLVLRLMAIVKGLCQW